MSRAITGFNEQPFRLDQKVVVEKRTPEGVLTFSPPQPPARSMDFREVYDLYFHDTPNGPPSAGWPELKAWLDARGWTVRACPWW